MMRTLIAFSLAGVLASSASLLGDTRAPSTQTFVINCGGATVTIVSPVFAALAAQVVGSTGTAILQQVVLSDGTVIFEHPSFSALKSSALTSCTVALPEGTVTLLVLMTPQRNKTD